MDVSHGLGREGRGETHIPKCVCVLNNTLSLPFGCRLIVCSLAELISEFEFFVKQEVDTEAGRVSVSG